MWETVELRELRVFLTLAEQLHFGRSADRLGLTQSRVSQALRELELKLGGQLFTRTSRRVALTPLGERFLAQLESPYAELTGVLRRTHAANSRIDGTLALSLLYPTAGGPHLTAIISTFEERHPRCEVQLSEALFDAPLAPLLDGDADLMAMRLPLDHPELIVGPVLSREPRVLEVARDHPLAKREDVSIEDVADYHVAPLSEFPPEMVRAVIPNETPSGRPIRRRRLRPTPRTPYEVKALIARGAIVHPTVASFADYTRHPDTTYVPVRDMPALETALVWRRAGSSPRVRAFVRLVREMLRGRSADAR
jgi:DNA-binding transcriptional LysR family regulator